MLKGRITSMSEVNDPRIDGYVLMVLITKPQNTFTKGVTEKDVKKKIQEFKHIHPGEIEFDYIDDEK